MILAELPAERPLSQLEFFVASALYGAQEKHNGERRIFIKQNGTVTNINREGKTGKPVKNTRLTAALLAHPLEQFVIDVELMKDGTIWIFDALILGDEVLHSEPYEYREARYHVIFENFNPLVKCVDTAWDEESKRALVLRVASSRGEGIVFRNRKAPYKEGRSNQHFKLKFCKDLDAVVLGPSPEGHDSVEIGVYNQQGELYRISGCSISGKKLKKPLVPGDVIAVRYLYATGTGHIVQPRLKHKREDKRAEECTDDQLVINKNWN